MKLIKLIPVIIFAILMGANNIFSQIDCPGGSDWSSSSVTYNFGDYGPGGQANYQSKSSGGVFQIKVDWTSYQNNSDFMSDNALKKVLETEAVRNVVPQYPWDYECDVYVYFVRECKVKVKLVLDLVMGAEVPCSDPGVTFCQSWYSRLVNGTQHSFYNIYQYINCGYKCCARIYHCTRYYDVILQQWRTSVGSPTTVSVTTCSGPSNFRDCLPPNAYLPCEDGTCDGYY